MKFLYKLYDTEYFGITLFIVIAVLIFLFLVILFFGKKDEKKKLEETKKLDLDKNTFAEADTKEDLSIPEVAQPVVESENLDNIFAADANGVTAQETNVANQTVDVQPALDEQPVVIDNVFENEPEVDNIFSSNEVKEEAPVIENTPVVDQTPIEEKPTLELPKMAEMPKLKEEAPVNNDIPVSSEKLNENKETVSDFDKLFGDIESETYNIDK